MLRAWWLVVFTVCLCTALVPRLVEHLVDERMPAAAARVDRVVTHAPVQVIDVAHAVSAMDVPTLIHLSPDEQIAEVDGVAVTDEYAAWRAIVTGSSSSATYDSATRAGRFVDLLVGHVSGDSRRVLLLLH